MERILNEFKGVVAIIGTGITWLLGSWDTALMVLIAFMALDYIRRHKKRVSGNI